MNQPDDGPVAGRLDIMMPRIVCVPPPPAVGVLPAAGTHQTFARKAAESAPHCAVRWYGDRIDVVNPERKLGRVERSWLMPKQRQHFGFDSAPRPHFARLRERLSVVAICLFWTDCNALPWGRSALARRPRLGLGFRPDCHLNQRDAPPERGKARDWKMSDAHDSGCATATLIPALARRQCRRPGGAILSRSLSQAP